MALSVSPQCQNANEDKLQIINYLPLIKLNLNLSAFESSKVTTVPNSNASKPELNANQSTHRTLTNTSEPSSHAPQFSISCEEWSKLMDDMRKIKIILKGHDKRIQQLEEALKASNGGSGAHSTAPKPSQ